MQPNPVDDVVHFDCFLDGYLHGQSEGHRRKESLLAALRRIAEACEGDPEAGHIQAVAALLEYIGDVEVKAAYEALERWYA